MAVIVGWLAPLSAQSPTTGAIDGTVEDQAHGSLPGVTLQARSPSLQGSRVTSTDAGGRFHLSSLPPGVYHLSAALQGFVPVDTPDIRVSLGETATVPLTMKIAASSEVEVSTPAPLLDTTSTTGGQNVRYDVIQKLPVGRNYADILRISPGVGTDNAETQGRATPFTIYGATSLENQYLVDGANTTNVIKGFQGKALPNEFVEEVQIKSSGYEAEYGRATGGVVNVITKSGGNELHGDVFGYFGAKGLTAASKARSATDSFFVDTTSEARRDYGVDVGGPFFKDRLWFFGAYNRIDRDQDQVPLAGTDAPTAGQNFSIAFSANVFSGKLTLRATDSTTFVATIFGDPERRDGTVANYQAVEPLTREGTRRVGGTDYTFSLLQLFGAVGVANARFAHHRDRYELTGKATGVQLDDFTVDPNLPILSGGFGWVAANSDDNTSWRDAWKADATVFAGSHEVKAGVDYERNNTDGRPYISGGQLVSEYPCPTIGASLCPPDRAVFYVHDFFTSSQADPIGGLLPDGVHLRPTTSRLGLFLQDAFKPLPNLTINVGLRYDEDDIRDDRGQRVFKLSGEWQPRIGIAWDVLRDGRSRVSASVGRFYYALPTALSMAIYGHRLLAETYNFSATSLVQDPAAPYPATIYLAGTPEPVQPGIKGIYQDELSLGFERAFDTTLSVGVRYTYRNLGRAIDDRCDFDPGFPGTDGHNCVILNPGSDDPFSTGQGLHACDGRADLGTAGNPLESQCTSPSIYPASSVPPARRRYQGIEVIARKSVKAVLFLQASYIYSTLRGNYDGAVSNFAGSYLNGDHYNGPSIAGLGQDFDYPALEKNADGKLLLDRPHSFRVDASYKVLTGVTVGLQAFLRSGAPISRREGYGIYGYETYVTERGSEGRQPWDAEVNVQLQYERPFQGLTLAAFVQAFNLLDRQTVLDTDQNTTIASPTGPNYVNPDYGKAQARRDPRSFRLGARVSF